MILKKLKILNIWTIVKNNFNQEIFYFSNS